MCICLTVNLIFVCMTCKQAWEGGWETQEHLGMRSGGGGRYMSFRNGRRPAADRGGTGLRDTVGYDVA